MEIIKIDSLAYKGYGVGRVNSRVVFVDYACPGDTLKIEIYDERKNYAFGKIIEIINPSQKRIAPVCRHFGVCGGCNYLHMPYEEELYWKAEIFKTEFKKAFKDFENVNLINDFKTQNYLGYRQKLGLKISPPFIGFYKKLSHNIVDIEYCELAKAGVNELLKNVRNILLNGNYRDNFLNEISSVTLTDTGLKNITFSLKNRIPNRIQNYDLTFKDIMEKTGADNVFVERWQKKGDKEGKKFIKYSRDRDKNDKNLRCQSDYFILKGKKFAHDLPSFIQINKEQNENIIEGVTAYIKNLNENRGIYFNSALDLFCGYGNITLFLADYAKMVTGVEADPFSVKLGEKNLKLNGIKNINFVMSSAGDFLEKTGKKGVTYDLIVLDPPRAGIKGLAPKIADSNPSSVIYISCDSMTLLRDLKAFAETGYLIEQINLIDMFPRTYHVEHVAFLSRK